MTIQEYAKLAQKTSSCIQQDEKLLNGALGLCGESGEFADLIKKHKFQGHPFDEKHAIKELGDILWYWIEACTGIGIDPSIVMCANIEKLKSRYPHGYFESEMSQHRKMGDI